MARMIPPYISDECRSPGEKFLFWRFKEDPGTAEWTILHSLGIARHPSRSEGEIDFVVIVPREGVLCIEVKSGNVARKNGIWRYGSGPSEETSTVGPFRQASEAMHALKNYIGRADQSLKSVLFFSCVFFTYIDFQEESAEWHPWQVADRRMLARRPVSGCVTNILRKAHEHFGNLRAAGWYDPFRSRPTPDQARKLADLLRGNFEYFVPPRTGIEHGERSIRAFTEEQYRALDVMQENPRIIFKGPAGTGKTFLALEAARRSIKQGNRTILSCYNALLGQWLTKQSETVSAKYQGLLAAGSFHKLMLRLSGISPPENPQGSFWEKDLPEAVVDGILSGRADAPQYECLILDEAQDLVSEPYLDVMDLLLEGGLAGGRWISFGDFERQAIYVRSRQDGEMDVPQALSRRSPVHFIYPLRINCRNARPIAIGIELLCKLVPGYSRILNYGEAPDVSVHFFVKQDEQLGLLAGQLQTLSQTFRNHEIVVLSPKEDVMSCAGLLLATDPSMKLRPLRSVADTSAGGFATIHAFKGLESQAVILTDIESIDSERAQALLYVGMSRARLRLVVLMHSSCRSRYTEAIRESFASREK